MARSRAAKGMKRYWETRARENATWYVDTSCDYDHPDMGDFFATGGNVVRGALLDAPVAPHGRGLAVEIGCGLGRISLALADHFEQVVGVDVSEEMVKQAESLVHHDRVSFRVGNGEDLRSLDDGTADFVLTFTVFQHMPDIGLIEGYVSEASRILKPGGVLAAQWNNLPHPRRWRVQGGLWRLARQAHWPGKQDLRIAPQFLGLRVPVARIRRMCERSGLEVVGVRGEGTLFAWIWSRKPGAVAASNVQL